MIITLADVQDIKKQFAGKKIAITGGVFDLVHNGHVHYLQSLKKEGQILIVAIPSDSYVSRRKGPGRPIQSAEVRAAVLDNMKQVDYTCIIPDTGIDVPPPLISALCDSRPDIFYLGEDSLARLEPYFAELKTYGITPQVIPVEKINSSSAIIHTVTKQTQR